LVVTDKNFGDTLYNGTNGRTEIRETFRDRVSDNPNTLVKPKILGTETLGERGQLNPL